MSKFTYCITNEEYYCVIVVVVNTCNTRGERSNQIATAVNHKGNIPTIAYPLRFCYRGLWCKQHGVREIYTRTISPPIQINFK